MVRGQLQIAALDLIVVLVHILDAQIGDGNLAGYNLEVVTLGDLLLQGARVSRLILRGAGEP